MPDDDTETDVVIPAAEKPAGGRFAPEIMAKLDRTLAELEKTSQTANGMLSENREAIADFSNDGLGQVGPTMRQLRSLIRELDDLADKVETNPAGFILGREQPEEFEP